LKLAESLPDRPNKFKGLGYATLGDYRTQFDLRTIRNVIIKQNSPQGDDSSMYEVFNRLNTGGINLKPQEIRMSMYHSAFYEMLYSINSLPRWRALLGNADPDLHMKDLEILLRGFALLIDGDKYAPSMVKFLNQFSRQARSFPKAMNEYLAALANSFFKASVGLPDSAFLTKNGRFNVALFEAAFVAACSVPLAEKRMVNGNLEPGRVASLASDAGFQAALLEGTTQTKNVKGRLDLARSFIGTH
jgi:hypothetical protein